MTTLEKRWIEYLEHQIKTKTVQLNIDRAALDALFILKSDFETIQRDIEKTENKT